MIKSSPQEYLSKSEGMTLLDVRSPSEYAAGHVPGAINMPLFNDAERAEVGTLYKQAGRQQSILKGLEVAGPKLAGFVQEARRLAKGDRLFIHCWRGGMRSANMAWLFELAGFEVVLLEGGYKAYRHYIREQLGTFTNMVVLGGKTGSGKTSVIEHISRLGFQVLDLEGIASHKGSAFGDLGQEFQPTNEQFENDLYAEVARLDPAKITFLEDESRGIGRISIPDPFYSIMRSTELVFMDVPKKERINRLVKEYAGFPAERLAAAINRIAKKLGGLNCKLALEALEADDFATVADILLTYYDKAYLKGLSIRDQRKVSALPVDRDDPEANARAVVAFFSEHLAGKVPAKV